VAKSKSKRSKKPKRARGYIPKKHPTPANGLVMVFGDEQAQDTFNRDYAALIKQIPGLLDTVNATLGLIGGREMTNADMTVLSLARMAFEDFRQILLLCSNGETTGGMKILRGMFERVATARYLDRNPEQADAFINFFPISRYKEALAARDFLLEEMLKELKAERDKVIGQYEIEDCSKCKTKKINFTWTRVDLPRMAEMTGLKLSMFPGYYLPMQETHVTLASIMRRVNFNERAQSFTYDETSTPNESRMTLCTAHYFVLAAIECLRDRFKLGESIESRFSQSLQGFNQVWLPSTLEGPLPTTTGLKAEGVAVSEPTK
jgi:uncharacterized protein DUF5677